MRRSLEATSFPTNLGVPPYRPSIILILTYGDLSPTSFEYLWQPKHSGFFLCVRFKSTSKGSKLTSTLAKTLNQALRRCLHTRLAKSLILTQPRLLGMLGHNCKRITFLGFGIKKSKLIKDKNSGSCIIKRGLVNGGPNNINKEVRSLVRKAI